MIKLEISEEGDGMKRIVVRDWGYGGYAVQEESVLSIDTTLLTASWRKAVKEGAKRAHANGCALCVELSVENER